MIFMLKFRRISLWTFAQNFVLDEVLTKCLVASMNAVGKGSLWHIDDLHMAVASNSRIVS